MADTAKIANFILKDGQGNIQHIRSFTENDVTKIKQALTDIAKLKQDFASSNAGQRQLAYKDFYSADTNDGEMVAGTYYMVPFNAGGEFLEFDPATGKPKNPQPVDTVVDLVVSYYEIVYKPADGAKAKLGRMNANISLANVLYDNKDATISSHFTFTQDVDGPAVQDVDSLADTKLATAKFVRDVVNKKVTEASHLTGKFYDTGKPDEGALVTNELAFYVATDLL